MAIAAAFGPNPCAAQAAEPVALRAERWSTADLKKANDEITSSLDRIEKIKAGRTVPPPARQPVKPAEPVKPAKPPDNTPVSGRHPDNTIPNWDDLPNAPRVRR